MTKKDKYTFYIYFRLTLKGHELPLSLNKTLKKTLEIVWLPRSFKCLQCSG